MKQIDDITFKMVQNNEKKSFTADEATMREFKRIWGKATIPWIRKEAGF